MSTDLGNGWKLVSIVSPGYDGWCNLVPVDTNSSMQPAMIPPEAAEMIRKLAIDRR